MPLPDSVRQRRAGGPSAPRPPNPALFLGPCRRQHRGGGAGWQFVFAARTTTSLPLTFCALLLPPTCPAGGGIETGRSSREAVLADASALLTCYGVGEESGAELTHAVVELLFTTSIE